MSNDEKIIKTRAMMKLCGELFTSNLIRTDFDDVAVLPVANRDFTQQPGGGGLHISFSVSWHAIGKTGAEAHDALRDLLPKEVFDDEE